MATSSATARRARGEREASGLLPRAANLDSAVRRLLAAGDAGAVLMALVLALTLPAQPDTHPQVLWGLAAVPLMIVLFKLYGLYDRDVKRISHSTVDDIPWLLHAALVGGLLFWLYARVSPMGRMDFAEILLFGPAVVALVTMSRFAMRQLAGRLIGVETAVLVGSGGMAEVFAGKLAAHPEYRLRVIGILEDGHSERSTDAELPVLGGADDLEHVASRYDLSRVIISPRDLDDGVLEELLRRCRALALKVSILPKLADVLGPAVEIDDVEGVTVLGINPPWLPRSSRGLKRGMDIAIASVLLLLVAPVMLVLAIAIKLDSRGPVFFAQERVGRRGRRFRLFKFRSMSVDAEQRREELVSQSTDPDWLMLDHDPRITRIGRTLRRASLDELPQLWNVLRGQMSMVGPRPLISAEDDRVQGWARGRLDLTPGITGYWQVLGRTRIPFEEMVKLDYLYVMNWSLWEDVRLMLRTLPVVLGGRGAN
jgi:exopolysaccharide biosynthesis polyprenyl glycosylphosphotransferase